MHVMDSLLMLLVRTHLNVHDCEGGLPACHSSRATGFDTHVCAVMQIAQKFACVHPLWDMDMFSGTCMYMLSPMLMIFQSNSRQNVYKFIDHVSMHTLDKLCSWFQQN